MIGAKTMNKTAWVLAALLALAVALAAWLWADNHALANTVEQLEHDNEQLQQTNGQLVIEVWDLKNFLTNSQEGGQP